MPRIAVRCFVAFALSAGTAAALGVIPGSAYGAPPANDDFSDRQEIAGATGTASGTTLEATKEAGEPDHAGNEGSASIWYRWTAPADGRVKFTTAGSTFDTLLAVYTGSSLGSLSTVARNDDAGAAPTSDVSFTARAGVRYVIAVDGFAGKRGSVILHWGTPPANDNFADAVAISGSRGGIRGTTVEASKEEGELDPFFGFGGGSVWAAGPLRPAGWRRSKRRGRPLRSSPSTPVGA